MFTCLECQCTYQGTGPRCEQCAKAISAQADDASAGFNQAPEKYDEMHELYSKMFPSPRNAMLVKDMAALHSQLDRQNGVGFADAIATAAGQIKIPKMTDALDPRFHIDADDLTKDLLITGSAVTQGGKRIDPAEFYKPPPKSPLTTILGWDMAQWAYVIAARHDLPPLDLNAAALMQQKYRCHHLYEPPTMQELSEELTNNMGAQFVVHMDPTKSDEPLPKAEIQSVVIGVDPGGRAYSVDEHGEFHVDDPVDKVAVDLSTTRVLR